ncbi:protein MAINTENANCE OF MERISTEMS-like [Amaranthus tricolor]|uniref:protein MAINTENANCE OF MERISTEMS-like n=1 Tax=Amaranthus tricolor TaxID=29722 RepID=UPI002582A18C|nr:protein MAINTENANCE OF MERISTEMS-like [Amaranthus tricolor]
MAIVGSTLLVDKIKTGMRPHLILTVNADQDEIAWGAVTLVYLYRQLSMASRAGYLTMLQTWIYEYFLAFRPHPCRADVPNKTRAEMWSPHKPVEWIPYNTSPRTLLNEHPRTTFIGGITCFDIVEVYLPERIVRQLSFVQAIPPPPLRLTQAVVHDYIDWFRVCSHPLLLSGEGPSASFAVADSRVGYFANEFPSQLAPLDQDVCHRGYDPSGMTD